MTEPSAWAKERALVLLCASDLHTGSNALAFALDAAWRAGAEARGRRIKDQIAADPRLVPFELWPAPDPGEER